MLQVLLLATATIGFGETDPRIQCSFPAADADQRTITVQVEPRPSLKDQPGLFRVIMAMNERQHMRASARPIAATDDRDIMIRAITPKKNMYTIGLRDDGKAALNIQKPNPTTSEPDSSTRFGYCTNFEDHINLWAPT